MKEPDKQTDELAKLVVDAALEVHRILGPGYLESVYEDAMATELSFRGIPFEGEKPIDVDYKGRKIGQGRLDFLVAGKLVVELKAVESFTPVHTAQVISHLKATGLPLGLLLNFNTSLMNNGIKRIVYSN